MSATAVTRRDFLKGGTALVIGFTLPLDLASQESKPAANPLNAWVKIAPDNRVTLMLAKCELGQGIMTTLPMVLADEADVDWNLVRIVHADLDPSVYDMGTGGSGSTIGNFTPMRQAGAAARQMLITAAAQKWNVPRESCRTSKSIIRSGSHQATYGELAEAASRLPIPDLKSVPLKNPADFAYIGKPLPRFEIPSKCDGSAQFGLDVRVPGMVRAIIARCPYYGGRLKTFDPSKAKAIPGVIAVIEVPEVKGAHTRAGVAVVAENTWAAMRGRDALVVDWDGAKPEDTTANLREKMVALADQPGKVIRNEGNALDVIAKASKKFEAVYETPFLAHATMEPMNCTVNVRANGAEIWAPTQSPEWIAQAVAQAIGVSPKSIVGHTTLSGGAFGRRYQLDFAVEAALVSKAVGKPVQVVWTREDDMRFDFYRQLTYHKVAAALDEQNRPVAWNHRLVSSSIREFWGGKPEGQELEGTDLPYSIPNVRLEYAPVPTSIPRAWWRSVANSFNAFVVQSFIDELAHAANQDPVAYRLSLLPNTPPPKSESDEPVFESERMRAVMNEAAARGGWSKPLSKGRARGFAAHYSFDTYVAQVAEVSVENNNLQVHRVTCAVDCGRAVNPDGVKAQMEGGIIYGLSAALSGEITVKDGAVEQSNFDDYPIARIFEAPEIEVFVTTSDKPPTGCGEPGVPPIAPAVTNAIFAATGQRVRKLPIRLV
jgi:isoquinoline 1-oxidoreductase beta subunit